MSRYINPQPRYVDDNGKALAGGKLFFYSAGTVTERDTYSDAAFTVPNTNPVILDANGRPQVSIFLNGSYKVVLKDALDNTVWEKDPVGGTIGVAAFDNWINDATYSVGDIVTGSDGDYYQSLTNGNIGLDPTIETNDWVRVQLVAEWRSAVTYKIGDIAKGSDDVLYTSLSNSNLANDPISDAVNWSSVRDYAGVANGFASLDGDGLVPASQIPPIAITDVYVVADQAARLALDAQVGDIAVQNDNNIAYILQSLPASTNANWIEFGIQDFGSAAFRNIGTGLTDISDNTQLNTRLGTTGNLGDAAQRVIGAGADQVPDKEILDTRLGTTGNLGDAAQRDVGVSSSEIAAYGTTGVSNRGYGSAQTPSIGSLSTLTTPTGFYEASGDDPDAPLPYLAYVSVHNRAGGAPLQTWTSSVNTVEPNNVPRTFIRRYVTGTSSWTPWAELWNDKNLANPLQVGDAGLASVGTSIPGVTPSQLLQTADYGSGFYNANGESAGAGWNSGYNAIMLARRTSTNAFVIEAGSSRTALFVNIMQNGDVKGWSQFAFTGVSQTVSFGSVTGTSFNRSSDATLKRIKKPLDCTREELDSLGVYLFDWLDVEEVNEQQRGTEDSGVMAQELLAIQAFKHCVHKQDNGKYTVDYGKAAFIYAILDRKLTKRGE